jgi:hypothetical protein
MNESVRVEGDDAQVEAELGMTVILTDQGWEAADYVDPENDWTPLEDGSYLAPDGRTRSWPLAGTEPP